MNHSNVQVICLCLQQKFLRQLPTAWERFSAWHQNPSIIWLQLTNHSCVLLYPSLALCSSQTGKLTACGKGLHPFWPLLELKCLPIPQTVLFFPFFKFQLECHTTKPFLPSSLWEESLHWAQPLTHHDGLGHVCVLSSLLLNIEPTESHTNSSHSPSIPLVPSTALACISPTVLIDKQMKNVGSEVMKTNRPWYPKSTMLTKELLFLISL